MIFKELNYSHISEIKEWAKHESISDWIGIDDWDAYYQYAINEQGTLLFAIYDNDIFIGEITAEKEDDYLNIMLIINPQYQNQGFGVKALKYFAENIESLIGCRPKYIHSGIFKENIASIKCFSKAGYIHQGNNVDGDERYIFYL